MSVLARAVLAFLLLATPVGAFAASTDLTIVTADGATHAFTVEIADDPMERARGLMFREQMAPDHGMLFDFAREDEVSFWMKNTPLSLDMLFAKADGTIVSIAENTTPQSTEAIPAGAPVRFVLEVVGGTAAKLGIAPGDRIEHARVTPAQ
ncbi:uncharacterized membrane protein (UPF0127 family) [Amorphus suaedae]